MKGEQNPNKGTFLNENGSVKCMRVRVHGYSWWILAIIGKNLTFEAVG